MKNYLRNYIYKAAPFLFLAIIIFVFMWKAFLRGSVAMPGDLMVGAYYPWHEYKWGYAVDVIIKNPLISDSFSQFFVWKKIIADSYKNLEFPLWNPYSYSGYPLLGNFHSGALYLINIVFVIFEFNLGWNLYIYLGFFLSSVAMYLFLHNNNYSKSASLVGSVTYSLSGFSISWSEFATAGQSMIWIPLSLFLVDKYFENNKKKYIYLNAIVLFVLNSVGHLQMSIYGYALISLYFVFKLYNSNLKNKISELFVYIISVSLSLLLSAVVLLPSIETANLSVRFYDKYIEGEKYGLLPIVHLVTLFAPDYFGNPATGNYWGFFNYHETIIYSGVLSFVTLVGLLVRLKKNSLFDKFFIFVMIISLILLFLNPISLLVYKLNLPLLSTSAAGRISGILVLSISVLVTSFVDKIKLINKQKFFTVCVASLLVLIETIIILLFIRNFYNNSYPELLQTNIERINISIRNLYLPLFLTVATFISLSFRNDKIRHTFLMVVVVADLFRFGWKYMPFVDRKLSFPETPAINFLKENQENYRVDKEYGPLLPPNTWAYYGLKSPSGYDPMAPSKYTREFFNRINGNKDIYSRYSEIKEYDCSKLSNYSVKYLLALKRTDKGVLPGDKIYYKIEENCWDKVFETDYVAVLENKNAKPIYELLNKKGSLDLVKSSNNKVELRYSTTIATKLVIRNTWYPGWKAYVNNTLVKVEIYDDIYQQITVPEGEGVVELVYFPDSFRNGLVISIISLIILLFLIFKK